MVLQKISWVGWHRAYPEMSIIPESEIVIAIIKSIRPEEVVIQNPYRKKQYAERKEYQQGIMFLIYSNL